MIKNVSLVLLAFWEYMVAFTGPLVVPFHHLCATQATMSTLATRNIQSLPTLDFASTGMQGESVSGSHVKQYLEGEEFSFYYFACSLRMLS